MSYLCQKCKKKKMGVIVFISEIKSAGNYPDFEKLAHVIQHGLQGFIVKNIKGESMAENYLRHVSWKWVCCVNNSRFYECFHKT